MTTVQWGATQVSRFHGVSSIERGVQHLQFRLLSDVRVTTEMGEDRGDLELDTCRVAATRHVPRFRHDSIMRRIDGLQQLCECPLELRCRSLSDEHVDVGHPPDLVGTHAKDYSDAPVIQLSEEPSDGRATLSRDCTDAGKEDKFLHLVIG